MSPHGTTKEPHRSKNYFLKYIYIYIIDRGHRDPIGLMAEAISEFRGRRKPITAPNSSRSWGRLAPKHRIATEGDARVWCSQVYHWIIVRKSLEAWRAQA